ncbi:MAG: serine/threonine-protein kinase [Gordonia sp. (in: high G+C Gram-positive bacteria)]
MIDDDLSGTTLGPYRLETLLGRGGMGQVYRAVDTRKDRVVALKLLNAHLADDASFRDRFLRESRVAARLNEPHVVPIHDWGEIDGLLFIDMRMVEGHDLRGILAASGALPTERALAILGQIADALDTAHAQGLVHRDIKPDNVLVDARDFAYLADFGLARTETDTRLTTAGQAVGSLAYMSPERFESGDVGPSGDVYALACVLYECLSGREPFAATSLEQVISAHLTAPPPRLGSPMDAVIARGMAKNPAERFATAGALITAAKTAASTAGSGELDNPAPAAATLPPVVRPQPAPGAPTSLPPGPDQHIRSTMQHSLPPVAPAGPAGTYPQTGPPLGYRGPVHSPPSHHSYPNHSYPAHSYPAAPARSGFSASAVVLAVVAVLLLGGIGVGAWLILANRSPTTGTDPATTAVSTVATTVTHSVGVPAPGASAPLTSTPVTPTPTATTTTSGRGAGDLGLTTPISSPACDGTGIVVVANAVTPGSYPQDIQEALARFSGSNYLRTDQSCSSLRRRDDNGNVIYAVYRVAGPTLADICRLLGQIGGDAYGKWLDNTTDPTTFITQAQCGQ